MSLFRPEVLETRRLQRMGRTIPIHSGNSLPITLVLLFGALVVSAWLVTGNYARTQLVSGWIVPNGPMARIQALQPGIITSIDVTEGQQVKAGQPLATLRLQNSIADSVDPAGQSLDILARQGDEIGRLEQLARQASRDEEVRLNATLAALETRMATADRQIAIQRQQVASAKSSLDLLAQAEREKAITKIDFENQRRAFLAEQAQLQALLAEHQAVRAQMTEARLDLRQVPIKLEQRLSELRESGIELDKQRLVTMQGSVVVLTAPFDGVVGVIQAKSGQTMGPQQPVMQVLGAGTRLEAELYAPTSAIGFAAVGQEVRLMYDAFPYEQYGTFSGTIREISSTVLVPEEVTAPIKLEAASYRVRIELAEQSISAFGQRYPVQPGMLMQANIILERQSFLDWVLEPVRAIRNRL
jgi:membrane fusion protein